MKRMKLRIILIVVLSLMFGSFGFFYGYPKYKSDKKRYTEKLLVLQNGFSSAAKLADKGSSSNAKQSLESAFDRIEKMGGPAKEPKLINYVAIPLSIGLIIGVFLPIVLIRKKKKK